MTKWLGEWLILSMLVVLMLGMVLIFWAVWPMLPERLPGQVALSLNLEGAAAMVMLLIVVVGFGKLMVGP
jgi:hypothetical protein